MILFISHMVNVMLRGHQGDDPTCLNICLSFVNSNSYLLIPDKTTLLLPGPVPDTSSLVSLISLEDAKGLRSPLSSECFGFKRDSGTDSADRGERNEEQQ